MNETRRAVLESLAGGPVTGPEIADALDVSRAAVWKHVEALREAGFEIEGGPAGYVLADVTGYDAATIEYGLDAPFEVEYHDAIESTNARARELAADGAADLVVVADEQIGGRGRLDREWASPAGGVWLSIVCRPDVPPARAPLFTLAAAVATAATAREAGVDARIKWPNDVVVPADVDRGYRKLAGILTEMEGETDRVDWLVCGVGLNANLDAESLPDGATSLRAESGDVDRRTFVQRLLERFYERRSDLDATVGRWRELALTLDRRVRVTLPDEAIEGRAVDVTEFGALIVETEDGRVTVTAGDCEHLRPA
ncbi:biotin--[acetyl-CoA-carboxylase] ligase [Halovivax sp.]|uniref:biotin--[acetyl-CoA-carboxylase] ligase n=1 Tax=Halovivax sp. TaxID=1935978 RepID=UPI0025C73056|nr:biotin--[acetyl-CoA-carboxylase] ligase [Halovivax sp.]